MGRASLSMIAVMACAAACSSGEVSLGAASSPDREAIERQRRPHELVAALALRPGDRVADLGAGRGFLEPYLVGAIGPRGRLVATDIDPSAVAALASLGPPIEARLVAPDEPGLERGSFDLILLADVDHLLRDRQAYLGRVVAALAPGGRIAISNRIDRESATRDAADRAGLDVVDESHRLPARFVIVLAPRGPREARR